MTAVPNYRPRQMHRAARPDVTAAERAPGPRPVVHPALAAEVERLDRAARDAELKLRQTTSRVASFAFGAWMALDGVLFIASGPQRLGSAVFTYPAEVVPYWPWPFALFISAAGLLLMWASAAWRPLAGGIAYMAIAVWQMAYWLLIWRAIAAPPPGLKLVSYPPISDHGALAAVACVFGIMLLRLWYRQFKVRRLTRAQAMRG